MPRDGSGVLSAPAGTTATSGTTIESAKYNAFVNDWVTDGNTARPIVAGGTGATTAGAALTALGAQASDAALTSIAGLSWVADRYPYATGVDTFAMGTITAAGRAILDDADAAAQRTTLGLGALATAASVTTAEIAAATLVTASETIASNNNDTTIPTSAAVKSYVDGVVSAVIATTSGTTVSLLSGLPSTVSEIDMTFEGVSTDTTVAVAVRLSSGGVFASSGYTTNLGTIASNGSTGGAAPTAKFDVTWADGAATAHSGEVRLRKKPSSNVWVMTANTNRGGAGVSIANGQITLSGSLDALQLFLNTGNFDAGSVWLTYR